MRSIEFIAPVESMRGNLSGRQDLVYNDHDNKAFEAPVGRQYAKNYQARFIGAKRASDNRKYFSVKTRSATRISDVTKLNMALLGASAVMYNVINVLEQSGTPEQKANIDFIRNEWEYMAGKTFEAGTSWKQFLMDRLRVMLASHAQYAEFGITLKTKVLNPYFRGTDPTPAAENLVVDIPQHILVKFWLELGCNESSGAPIYFKVNGASGLAFTGDTFQEVISATKWNVCDLHAQEYTAGNDYIVQGNEDTNWLKLGATFITPASSVVADGKYITTREEPA